MAGDEINLSGQTVARRYRVLRKLGKGGMGSVWLVQHTESLQSYALKTLHPRASQDRMMVERFLREARAAAALHSKHVVKIVDADMSHADPRSGQAMPFLVMELLQGQNLEQYVVTHGKLDAPVLVWILQQCARALDMAHAMGIVHRDLKPENIFVALDEDSEPITKVCDFGIAKLSGDAASGLLSTGAMGTDVNMTLGTPMYMSPEQARSSANVGPESDQWAVGLIAFKCLTGREYFSGAQSTADLLLKIVNDPLEPPTRRLSTLPAAFDEWFARSCERDPKKRWPSVSEQVRTLTTALLVDKPVAPTIVRGPESFATADTEVAAPEPKQPSATPAPAPSARPSLPAPASRRGAWLYGAGAVIVVAAVAVAYRNRSSTNPSAETSSSATKSGSSQVTTMPAEGVPLARVVANPSTTVAEAGSTLGSVSAVSAATASSKKLTAGKTSPVASASATASSSPPAATATSKLPPGSACERSSECASNICAAFSCQ